MTIDPRWSIGLSLALAILAFLAGSGAAFADLGLDAHTVKATLAGITILLGIGNAVNAVLGAIPSKPGQTAGFYLGPSNPPQAKP